MRVRGTMDGEVGRVTLCAPERRNAIDQRFVEELDEAVASCAGSGDLRALLIDAEGPAFTVGGDLRHLGRDPEDLASVTDPLLRVFHRALVRIASLSVPVVCAVRGAVAGGGLGIVWASDVVLASEDARFATAFAHIGFSGDGGSSWWLPRLVGLRRAQTMMLLGEPVGADEAYELGFVTRIVDGAALDEEAQRVTERFATGPTAAYGEMRTLLRTSGGVDLREGLEREEQAMQRIARTADAQHGIVAFTSKTTPRFVGR